MNEIETPMSDANKARPDRRELLKRIGLIAGGGTAAAIAAQVAAAPDANAEYAGNLVMGESNDPGGFSTLLWNTGAPDPLGRGDSCFVAIQNNTSGIWNNTPQPPGALCGDTDSAIGVVGASLSNNGVYGVAGAQSNTPFVQVSGVLGDSKTAPGVQGVSTDNTGVIGQSANQIGVAGYSTNLTGVRGKTLSPTGWGIVGEGASVSGLNAPPSGVVGNSGPATVGVTGLSVQTGVYGKTSSPQGWGVVGEGSTLSGLPTSPAAVVGNSAGLGILGLSHSSAGVYGAANAGGGSGVVAQGTGGAYALKVQGAAGFSRSGIATVPTAAKSVTVPNVAVSAASFVLATIQGPGSNSVAGVVTTPSAASFTINLVLPAVSATKVAWFVIN